MYKIRLNTSIPYNYSFYCPDANIMLDHMNSSVYVKELTASIKRGIHGKTLVIDAIVPTEEEKSQSVNSIEDEHKKECVEVVVEVEKEQKEIVEEAPKKTRKKATKVSKNKK